VPAIRPHLARLSLLGLLVVAALLVTPSRASAALPRDLSPTLAPMRPAVLVTHGARGARVVALTFDDGYNPAVCGALVDVLERTGTPATFFPNSVHVAQTPQLWRRVAALGFPIGNHTATHPLMPRLSYADQVAQIELDRRVLEAAIGGPSLLVFRPPYGAIGRGTLLAAREAGYPIVLNWDASFADASRRANGRRWPIASYIRAATRGVAGSVVLGHCGNQVDLAALPEVIASYRSRGFTFVTVPQLLGLPGAAPMCFPGRPTLPSPAPAPLAPASPIRSDPPSTSPPTSRPPIDAAPGSSSPAAAGVGSSAGRWISGVRTVPIP
jgi:peptidoglycan/xylan/chitin deacetylase (PgdA/CDA1 family)